MPIEPVSIAVKVGVEVLTKVAPKGIAWLSAQMFGMTLLVIGERRAGKSSFVNYFEYGVLLSKGTRTPRTQEIRDTASFDLSIGRDKALRMSVRKATDTRGHDTPKEQAALVVRRKPTVLMIFLDVSRDWDASDEDYGYLYLKKVLEELNSKTIRSKGVSNNLKHLCIVLNKADEVDATEYQKKVRSVKGILRAFGAPNWGPGKDDIAIYRCISIDHDEALQLLDGILKSIVVAAMLKDQ
ncbi:MAG: GTPase domain-containing protein [Xanthobacteraceae bacterium]